MSKVKYNVVAKVGEYTNRDGETKPQWHKCGVIIQTDKGFSMKLDAVPISGDGWFKLFEPRENENQSSGSKSSGDDFDDDIPF